MQDLQAVINPPEKSPLFYYFWLCCFPVEEIISLWCHIRPLRLKNWFNGALNKLDTASVQQAAENKHLLKPTGSKTWTMASFRRAAASGEWEIWSQAAPPAPRMRNSCNTAAITTAAADNRNSRTSTGNWNFQRWKFDADESKGSPETRWELRRNCRDFQNVPLYLACICVGLLCQITPSIATSESSFRREPKWQLLGSQRWL